MSTISRAWITGCLTFLVSFVVACGTCICNEASTGCPANEIIFERDDQLWLYDLKSGEKKKIANRVDASLSPCGKKLAYAYPFSSRTDDEIFVMNIHQPGSLLKIVDGSSPVLFK